MTRREESQLMMRPTKPPLLIVLSFLFLWPFVSFIRITFTTVYFISSVIGLARTPTGLCSWSSCVESLLPENVEAQAKRLLLATSAWGWVHGWGLNLVRGSTLKHAQPIEEKGVFYSNKNEEMRGDILSWKSPELNLTFELRWQEVISSFTDKSNCNI